MAFVPYGSQHFHVAPNRSPPLWGSERLHYPSALSQMAFKHLKEVFSMFPPLSVVLYLSHPLQVSVLGKKYIFKHIYYIYNYIYY